ncbi:MAG: hypothetical protein JWQ49_6156, partial [Edaphobacter sp.]|nr:hypothetical protein [Edaphobacter sp.]
CGDAEESSGAEGGCAGEVGGHGCYISQSGIGGETTLIKWEISAGCGLMLFDAMFAVARRKRFFLNRI